jgi:pantoate--beta-alanine ligase
MARLPRILRNVSALRSAVGAFRRRNAMVALVPTMGALHDGHLALVRLARRRARRVIVSIFVNPAQFAPNEDFASYPRNLKADVAALAKEGVDLVWAPGTDTMYPSGFATRIAPEGPAKAGLEDAFRPHFFGGVATVVGKLLIQCAPDVAVFGQKDYQQLKVITRLVADLDLPVKIVAAPIIREKDGLAMSSRNVYLSAEHRAAAPALYRSLSECARRIAGKEHIARVLDEGAAAVECAGFNVDYFEARNADTLAKVETLKDGPIRLLAAARLGATRLIDNVAVKDR